MHFYTKLGIHLGHRCTMANMQACPCVLQLKKKKNVSHDAFGTQLGRVHVQKMDLSKLQTRKMKGLKRKAWQSEEQVAALTSRSDDKPSVKKLRTADVADIESD